MPIAQVCVSRKQGGYAGTSFSAGFVLAEAVWHEVWVRVCASRIFLQGVCASRKGFRQGICAGTTFCAGFVLAEAQWQGFGPVQGAVQYCDNSKFGQPPQLTACVKENACLIQSSAVDAVIGNAALQTRR